MSNKNRRLDSRDDVPDLESLLTNLDTGAADFEIDLDLSSDLGGVSRETPVDFSFSNELVPIASSGESALELAKMNDHEVLNREVLREKRIVYPEMEDYSIINSFREIRTQLLKKSENRNFVVIVTTIGRGMSTTNTVVNLGSVFCYEGDRTALLIDCQSQDDNIASLLDRGGTRGLSDYVEAPDVEIGDVIFPTGIRRMRLIPFGTRSDAGSRIVTSEKYRELLGSLKRRHADRFLFINAAPLEVSADATIMSEFADFVIVVVPYGKVSKGRLNKAIRSLPPEKMAGVVMSDCKRYG